MVEVIGAGEIKRTGSRQRLFLSSYPLDLKVSSPYLGSYFWPQSDLPLGGAKIVTAWLRNMFESCFNIFVTLGAVCYGESFNMRLFEG